MAIRTLLLVAALAAGLVDVVAAQHPFDDLPRWDFWPPLVGGARFTGRYLSSEPGGIHLKRQSFEPIDLFQLQVDKPSTNALLYGNVLLDPIFPADLTTDSAVQAAFQAAVKSIKTHANVHVSPEIKLVQATVFPLKVTGDNGESEMSILQDSTGVDGRMYRFTSHVTFGFNFYLTLEDAKFNLRHRAVVALDREAEHNVFQHTFSPLEEVADEETDEAVKCDYPHWGEIDVYVTHLSLSEQSREQTKVEIWEYMRQGKGKTQVLLGDLNSEPQSLGIRFLSGKAELLGQTTDMKDAWLEVHEEAEPRSTDPDDRQHKFTFPSDNPSKRIDFVLYRGEGQVKECEIIGQDPTEDTKDFPDDVGMLHASSPVYASDHRGVVVEFE
ncbi:hypothetical protein JG687_00001933 [Phytophthora cactorum]|uniref:Endonuclease/exonuclease/phosphatase domain-containing protein n=1 Tax=Phytophthora cactorum TaxID=29920 RepID=A0A8T1UWS7_9STRA|nr:hypothetical protein JG687_00001933 [Phytophthora cactorum]